MDNGLDNRLLPPEKRHIKRDSASYVLSHGDHLLTLVDKLLKSFESASKSDSPQ
jgi:hypothetical protein